MNRILEPPERILTSFSNSERVIYDYLLENLEEISKSNISKIASAVYTSPASIFNLLKKLGYSGFKEFKFEVCNYLKELKRSTSYDNSEMQNFRKIIYANDIVSTINMQNNDNLKHICDSIHNANRVLVLANEITRFVAMDFTYRMQLCDVDIIYSCDYKQYKVLLSKNIYDYVIIFSKFGNTEKLIKAIETTNVKANLLITTNTVSYLEKYCNEILLGSSTIENTLKDGFGDISSRIGLYILSDMLINTYVYSYLDKSKVM